MTSRGWWVVDATKSADKGTPRREPVLTIGPSCGLLVRGLDGCDLLLLLGDALGDERVVLGLLLLLALDPAALEGTQVTTTLETERGNQTLDFGTKIQDNKSS